MLKTESGLDLSQKDACFGFSLFFQSVFGPIVYQAA
jgi:hypothetical protein